MDIPFAALIVPCGTVDTIFEMYKVVHTVRYSTTFEVIE
jgi:hypothetical protein